MAEKARDLVLIFADFDHTAENSGDVSPDLSFAPVPPETVVVPLGAFSCSPDWPTHSPDSGIEAGKVETEAGLAALLAENRDQQARIEILTAQVADLTVAVEGLMSRLDPAGSAPGVAFAYPTPDPRTVVAGPSTPLPGAAVPVTVTVTGLFDPRPVEVAGAPGTRLTIVNPTTGEAAATVVIVESTPAASSTTGAACGACLPARPAVSLPDVGFTYPVPDVRSGVAGPSTPVAAASPVTVVGTSVFEAPRVPPVEPGSGP